MVHRSEDDPVAEAGVRGPSEVGDEARADEPDGLVEPVGHLDLDESDVEGGSTGLNDAEMVDSSVENEPTEVDANQRADDDAGPPDRFSKIRRTTAGAMMTGIAIGFQQVFELPKKESAFVIKAASDPNGPKGPIDLQFDPDDPTKTVAIIRHQHPDGTEDPASSAE